MNTMTTEIAHAKADLKKANNGVMDSMDVLYDITNGNRCPADVADLFNDSILDYIKLNKKISIRELRISRDLDRTVRENRVFITIFNKTTNMLELIRDNTFDISWNSFNIINESDITDKEFKIIHSKIINDQIISETTMMQDIASIVKGGRYNA